MTNNLQPKLTEPAIALIKHMEGCRLDAYRDAVGVWTIGYGHTKGVRPGMTITQAQADRFLVDDLRDAQKTIASCVKVPLTDNQYGALTSLVFNIGSRAFKHSTCLKELNRGNCGAAANAMELFVKGRIHGRKRTLRGLERRRRLERTLFDTVDGIFDRKGVIQIAEEDIPMSTLALDTAHKSIVDRLIQTGTVTPRKHRLRKSLAVAGAGSVAAAAVPVTSQDSFDDIWQHIQLAWQELLNSGVIPTQAGVIRWADMMLHRAEAFWHNLLAGHVLPSHAELLHWFGTVIHSLDETTPHMLLVHAQDFADSHSGMVWLGSGVAVLLVRSIVRGYVRRVLRNAFV